MSGRRRDEEERGARRLPPTAGPGRSRSCQDRELVTLYGTLRTVMFSPRGGVPALEGELYDGTGTVKLVWLGRRRIAGIHPGPS